MGIMNKMKTVALKDLEWSIDTYGFNATGLPDDCKIGTSSVKVIAKVSGFDLTWNWALTADNTYSISTRKIWIRADRFNRDVSAFVQYLTEVNAVLTYETIDSVEEKIASYGRYFRLKDLSWAYESQNNQVYSPVIDNPQELIINTGWNPV